MKDKLTTCWSAICSGAKAVCNAVKKAVLTVGRGIVAGVGYVLWGFGWVVSKITGLHTLIEVLAVSTLIVGVWLVAGWAWAILVLGFISVMVNLGMRVRTHTTSVGF